MKLKTGLAVFFNIRLGNGSGLVPGACMAKPGSQS